MPVFSGKIEAISVKEIMVDGVAKPDNYDNTHRLSFMVGETWFSGGSNKGGSYVNKDVQDLGKGDEVEFMYVVKGDFKNVTRTSFQRMKKAPVAEGGGQAYTPSAKGGSPNPAAVGQVLNLILDSGWSLGELLAASDSELSRRIQEVNAAKDRIASLWNGESKAESNQQQEQAAHSVDEDDIPF
jgi:hypothetical protein